MARSVVTAKSDEPREGYLYPDGIYNCPPGWVLYSYYVPGEEKEEKKASSCAEKDKYKFHISVEHNLDTLRSTINIITPILKKHKIKTFKHASLFCSSGASEEKVVERNRNRNIDGKAFCVYINQDDPQESNPIFWVNIIKEIEAELTARKVPCHTKGPIGDGLLSGCRYIYYRSPNNVMGEYVEAELLQSTGFTRDEAQNLSANPFLEEISRRLVASESKESVMDEKKEAVRDVKLEPAPLRVSTALLTDIEKDIVNRFNKDIGVHDGVRSDFIADIKHHGVQRPFIAVCFGNTKYYDQPKVYKSYELALMNYLGITIVDSGKDLSFNSSTALMPLKPYLEEVARRVVKIRELIRVKVGDRSFTFEGNIIPVLYHEFFKPLYEQIQKPENKELSVAELVARYIHSERLISKLVSCSLRDPHKEQIWHVKPKFLFGLEEDPCILLSRELSRDLTRALMAREYGAIKTILLKNITPGSGLPLLPIDKMLLNQILSDAILENDPALVLALIKQGCDLNRATYKITRPDTTEHLVEFFPLISAAKRNRLRIIRLLLANGAEVNPKDRDGRSVTPTVFDHLIKYGHFASVKQIAEEAATALLAKQPKPKSKSAVTSRAASHSVFSGSSASSAPAVQACLSQSR